MGGLVTWWTGVFVVPFGLFLVAFTNCAIAELAARVAVRLTPFPSKEARADRLEEWLGVIQNLRPRERPAEAASMLWSGCSTRLRQWLYRSGLRARLGYNRIIRFRLRAQYAWHFARLEHFVQEREWIAQGGPRPRLVSVLRSTVRVEFQKNADGCAQAREDRQARRAAANLRIEAAVRAVEGKDRCDETLERMAVVAGRHQRRGLNRVGRSRSRMHRRL